MLASETRQRQHLVLREAAHADRVDLHRLEPGRLRRVDARDDPLEPAAARHLPETVRVERVEADVDAPQPRVPERLRLLGQQQAVRRQADVADAVDLADHAHEHGQVAAHERLTARQPNLVHAQRGRHRDEVGDLLEAEQLAPIEKCHLLRHAIGAAEVAAIGHADAQVVVRAPEQIE